MRLGRLVVVFPRVPALGPSLAGEIVWGVLSLAEWAKESVVASDSLLLREDWESVQDEPDPDDSCIMMSESVTRVDSFCTKRQEDKWSSVGSTLLRISSNGSSMVGRRMLRPREEVLVTSSP